MYFLIPHGKNDFIKVSKNLIRYRSENFIGFQNNYVERSIISNVVNFDILTTNLNARVFYIIIL